MVKIKIGYNAKSYLETRNIIGICKNQGYIRRYDYYYFKRLASFLLQKIKSSSFKNDYKFQFKSLDIFKKVDIHHFFNTISYSNTPWITTFETIVPRFQSTMTVHSDPEPDYSILIKNPAVNRALERLAEKDCKKLIALSNSSKEIQLDLIKHFPHLRASIEKKLCVMHPPQKTLLNQFSDKGLNYDQELRFIFVGASFHRKGGSEILKAFKKFAGKYNFKLIIISSLRIDNYATRENEEDIISVKNILANNQDWIEYYSALPNEQVLEIMRTCHIGLLPTWADSYGFSVLEMQASGCPVISTNIRALPEINNEEVGWVIEVPKNRLGEGLYKTGADRRKMSAIIENGLEQVLNSIFDKRSLISRKAEKAFDQIKLNHDPLKFEASLEEIYQKALS